MKTCGVNKVTVSDRQGKDMSSRHVVPYSREFKSLKMLTIL